MARYSANDPHGSQKSHLSRGFTLSLYPDSINSVPDATEDLVSIVMPAYNASRYLEAAVESVFAQTYRNWELLIVNDASGDNTLELAQSLRARDTRVSVFTQDRNRGVAAARNRALENASGKYIAFLDSDDLWVPDKIEQQIEYMERTGVLVSYGDYVRIDEQDKRLGLVRPPGTVDYAHLLKSNFIGNLTGMYNAETLGKQVFSSFKHEDYVAWLALVKKAGQAGSVGRMLGYYRVYSGSTSSNKLKTASWQWKIYRHSEALGLLRSICLLAFYAYYALSKRV